MNNLTKEMTNLEMSDTFGTFHKYQIVRKGYLAMHKIVFYILLRMFCRNSFNFRFIMEINKVKTEVNRG